MNSFTWLKELIFFWIWLKELNLVFLDMIQRIVFWIKTQRIEPLFFWLKELTLFLYDSQNWTFSNMTQGNVNHFSNMTRRIECFSMFHKELIFLWLKGLNFFLRLRELNLFCLNPCSSNMTQRIEPSSYATQRIELFFFICLKELIFFSRWLIELDLFFLTQRIVIFFDLTQRIVLFWNDS